MISGNLNCPVTSSIGRIFDAVSSITETSCYSNFEGQAAMQLEFEADSADTNDAYPFKITDSTSRNSDEKFIVDWELIILSIIENIRSKIPKNLIAAKFHNTLANIILETAKKTGEKKVVLSGGCFQNKYLTEKTIQLLQKEGFKPYWHQRVPTNDGGISLGQITAVNNQMGET
jgi:hydrogenase maturation protein HypF